VDGALRLVRFVRVGERYEADTIRLTLRPPTS
jgi:hypothetical protein